MFVRGSRTLYISMLHGECVCFADTFKLAVSIDAIVTRFY